MFLKSCLLLFFVSLHVLEDVDIKPGGLVNYCVGFTSGVETRARASSVDRFYPPSSTRDLDQRYVRTSFTFWPEIDCRWQQKVVAFSHLDLRSVRANKSRNFLINNNLKLFAEDT